jgi:BirA family biotin operon repressor/biotin-[acetyl-CoA-carboxylase] ligase
MLDLDALLKRTFLAQAEHHAQLSSTNDQARNGLIGVGQTPRLIVAEEQTTGRGRNQTTWWTGSNSLAFSLVLDGQPFQDNLQRRPMMALVAGIVVTEAIQSLLESPDMDKIGLHWPNDVFVDDRKLCGILVEVPQDGRIIVGIGLNTNDRVADAPPELADRLTTLRELTKTNWDHTRLLIEILNRFEHWQKVLMDSPDQVGRRADELCLQHGRQLAIDPGDGQVVSGRCLGIAPDGAIRLDTPDGPRPFYSGRLVQEPK